jgi:hypothetical protein
LVRRIDSGPRVEHAQQIRQRRDAAYRGACGGRTALLLQGDCWRQARNVIDVRHRHLMKQTPCIRGYRLQIAALSFRIQRSKRQRCLAGAGYAGEYDQRITGHLDVDALEVVLACPPDGYETAGARISSSADELVFPGDIRASVAAHCRRASGDPSYTGADFWPDSTRGIWRHGARHSLRPGRGDYLAKRFQ